jgi:hypothetical protein
MKLRVTLNLFDSVKTARQACTCTFHACVDNSENRQSPDVRIWVKYVLEVMPPAKEPLHR